MTKMGKRFRLNVTGLSGTQDDSDLEVFATEDGLFTVDETSKEFQVGFVKEPIDKLTAWVEFNQEPIIKGRALPFNTAAATTPPASARERLAAAAAEMKQLRNAAAAEFRAEIDRIGKRMGFDIIAEPRMIRTRGVFTLGAELVIVERTESDRSDIDGDDI